MVPAQNEQITPYDELKRILEADKGQLTHLLPRAVRQNFTPGRLMVIALNAFIRMGLPRDLDLWSLRDAVIWAAQLGLEGGTDQAYFVPYKGKVQLTIGPRGLRDCAYRHPSVKKIESGVALTDDQFSYDLGDDGYIRFTKAEDRPANLADREPLFRFAYAFCKLTNGETLRTVLTRGDVMFRRSFSKAKSGPWFDNPEGMWRKSAIKAGAHDWPRDPLFALALHEDENGAYAPPARTPKETLEMIEDRAVPEPTALPAGARVIDVEPAAESANAGRPAREPGQDG
jgi:phage RecT family recombinase